MSRRLLWRLGAATLVFCALAAAFPLHPWHWDEFQLAYALHDFDLARHQPHPPGYYLFVVAGRALLPLTGDAIDALRCVSALSLAAFVALALAQQRAGRSHALVWLGVAVAFVLVSPLTRRFGVAALSYAAEGSVWLAWLLAVSRASSGRGRLAVAAAGGLAGGLRPTLALWAAAALAFDIARRRDWRSAPALALAGAGGVAVWALPLLAESGGPAGWREASAALAAGNVWAKSIFAAGPAVLPARLAEMGLDLAASLGGLLPLVLVAAGLRLRRGAVAEDGLLAGAALAFGFYACVLYDTPGYLMATALPLAAWALRTVAAAAGGLPPAQQLVAGAAALVALVLGAAVPVERVDARYPEHDRLLETRFAAVRTAFDPDTSVLVTSREYWDYALRHVGHALPGFATLQLTADPYFAIRDDRHPYLVSRNRRVDALGPEPLDLARVAPAERLEQVVYMVPFDAQEFVARTCGDLASALETDAGETLPVLRVQPGWRIEARRNRLHCVPPLREPDAPPGADEEPT